MKRGQKRTSRFRNLACAFQRDSRKRLMRETTFCVFGISFPEKMMPPPPGMRPPPCALDDEMLLRTEAVLPARRPSLTLTAAFLPLPAGRFPSGLARWRAMRPCKEFPDPFYRGDAQVATQVCGRRIVDRSERSVDCSGVLQECSDCQSIGRPPCDLVARATCWTREPAERLAISRLRRKDGSTYVIGWIGSAALVASPAIAAAARTSGVAHADVAIDNETCAAQCSACDCVTTAAASTRHGCPVMQMRWECVGGCSLLPA